MNKSPIRWSRSEAEIWRFRFYVLLFFFVFAVVGFFYAAFQNNKMVKRIDWLEENTVPSIVRPKEER